MLIDCDTCVARPRACGGCVVSHLLSARAPDSSVPRPVTLDDREWVAVGTLAAAGLVPPLRLVPGGPSGRWRQDRDSA